MCTCRHLAAAETLTGPRLDAEMLNCLQDGASAGVGCEKYTGHFTMEQFIPRFHSVHPRAEVAASNSTNSTTTPTTGSNSSTKALPIIVATVGFVFVGFLLYFAWQCIGCIRGSRSGKPAFGYVGV
ncbi:hypothetical protein RSOLAG1IB_09213 [Rhizoctonia solani AG-1 IB]|uniref:Uncharacterized protein n=1 Tax=Thanatephorus cucumeris (strain AG1-IB / isolate 7/3/14) TaxID=1108050 RepID=A0A0B7FSR7_THACB|nr:hypothetical protein RSOLAG1IB_09213 [Rhizoctonia solani AG-1 IB]